MSRTVADLVHDLRSPIVTIMLWEQIVRETADPIIRMQGLDAIRESAAAQTLLIDELERLGGT